MKRDLISLHDLTSEEIVEILSQATRLKKDDFLQTDHLRGKNRWSCLSKTIKPYACVI